MSEEQSNQPSEHVGDMCLKHAKHLRNVTETPVFCCVFHSVVDSKNLKYALCLCALRGLGLVCKRVCGDGSRVYCESINSIKEESAKYFTFLFDLFINLLCFNWDGLVWLVDLNWILVVQFTLDHLPSKHC